MTTIALYSRRVCSSCGATNEHKLIAEHPRAQYQCRNCNAVNEQAKPDELAPDPVAAAVERAREERGTRAQAAEPDCAPIAETAASYLPPASCVLGASEAKRRSNGTPQPMPAVQSRVAALLEPIGPGRLAPPQPETTPPDVDPERARALVAAVQPEALSGETTAEQLRELLTMAQRQLGRWREVARAGLVKAEWRLPEAGDVGLLEDLGSWFDSRPTYAQEKAERDAAERDLAQLRELTEIARDYANAKLIDPREVFELVLARHQREREGAQPPADKCGEDKALTAELLDHARGGPLTARVVVHCLRDDTYPLQAADDAVSEDVHGLLPEDEAVELVEQLVRQEVERMREDLGADYVRVHDKLRALLAAATAEGERLRAESAARFTAWKRASETADALREEQLALLKRYDERNQDVAELRAMNSNQERFIKDRDAEIERLKGDVQFERAALAIAVGDLQRLRAQLAARPGDALREAAERAASVCAEIANALRLEYDAERLQNAAHDLDTALAAAPSSAGQGAPASTAPGDEGRGELLPTLDEIRRASEQESDTPNILTPLERFKRINDSYEAMSWIERWIKARDARAAALRAGADERKDSDQ